MIRFSPWNESLGFFSPSSRNSQFHTNHNKHGKVVKRENPALQAQFRNVATGHGWARGRASGQLASNPQASWWASQHWWQHWPENEIFGSWSVPVECPDEDPDEDVIEKDRIQVWTNSTNEDIPTLILPQTYIGTLKPLFSFQSFHFHAPHQLIIKWLFLENACIIVSCLIWILMLRSICQWFPPPPRHICIAFSGCPVCVNTLRAYSQAGLPCTVHEYNCRSSSLPHCPVLT